ncbi:transcriptional activator hac1 [Purpureocillium lavendulum]|uniref:Transcriptional activator hac1 n=1 Tax=Purpureocillium lavendulum TaxID=1247861 RepID=A0AB34FRU1_9HYPO|nr:transcriptional activator hac1 [Purpureocillium lavendulum]
MALQQSSPMAKVEASPVESFVSTPGDNYASLFSATSPSSPSATINPMDMMTPKSYADDVQDLRLSVVPEDPALDEGSPAPESSDKKPAKKRKSWGQVLPEPKTNLPPRKRAKTEDEKEQRRVERVLRNRRAAQSSRERKRLEVEALEKKTKELETALANAEKANKLLAAELNRVRRASGVGASSSPLDPLRDNQITLSQQLFSSQDGVKMMSDSAANLVDQLMLSNSNPTVNPASLSPELGPVSDVKPEDVVRPAVSHVGGGAQVVHGLADSVTPLGLDSVPQDDAAFSLSDSLHLSEAFGADRYLLESSLLASPNSSTLDDDYLAGDSAAGVASFDPFNIDDYLNDEANHIVSDIMAASDFDAADYGLEPQVHDPEIQVS